MPSPPPSTIAELCSSGSISHREAIRMRRRWSSTTGPSSGSVRSRKSSSPRRQTRRGAITRPFGVSSSASHDSAASTSFERIRCRRSPASGPWTRTYARGRTYARVVGGELTEIKVVAMFRSAAERKVREAGYDPARLPPGQYLTEKWPVLHAGEIPHVDLASWTLRVFGSVEEELTLDWVQFNALPRSSTVQDIHCVTRWSRFDAAFEGVHWRELAKLCRPRPEARFVIAHAEHDFTSNVPLASLEDERALLATHADGAPLTAEHGGPMRLVVPGRYFWKSAKWLRAIELSPVDRLGFWERYGYHNDADPWKEERYSF